MAKKKKILCLGSGGMILGNFIRYVFHNHKPYSISSLDRVRESHLIHNIYVNSDHEFYIADIMDQHILHVIFQKEKPDIVIFGIDEKSNNNQILSSNIIGTQNVINECLDSNIKLIYLSTDKVFGPISENDSPCSENTYTNPKDIYAISKLAGEQLVRGTIGLSYNIIRLSNNYGPWQTNNNLIPNIISSILENKSISIYGNGKHMRDWTHVYDSCSALCQIIETGIDKEIYNISYKQEYYNIEVFQMICNLFEKGHNLIKFVEDVPNNGARFAMSNEKILSLGWVPEYKFKDGLSQICQWYVSNQYILKM